MVCVLLVVGTIRIGRTMDVAATCGHILRNFGPVEHERLAHMRWGRIHRINAERVLRSPVPSGAPVAIGRDARGPGAEIMSAPQLPECDDRRDARRHRRAMQQGAI